MGKNIDKKYEDILDAMVGSDLEESNPSFLVKCFRNLKDCLKIHREMILLITFLSVIYLLFDKFFN